MLLQQGEASGAALLCVTGSVDAAEAGSLVETVSRSLAQHAAAVVVDLCDAVLEDDRALQALAGLAELPSGWPRSALLVCPPTGALPEPLTAADRAAALERVAQRESRVCVRVDLPAGPQAAATARAAVRDCAERLDLGDDCEDVLLVVSEMVTNAVRHATPPIALEVECDEGVVVVAVCDASPQAPQARTVGADAEGGRGLLLVDLLAEAHGVRVQPPGKTVWARLRRAAAS